MCGRKCDKGKMKKKSKTRCGGVKKNVLGTARLTWMTSDQTSRQEDEKEDAFDTSLKQNEDEKDRNQSGRLLLKVKRLFRSFLEIRMIEVTRKSNATQKQK